MFRKLYNRNQFLTSSVCYRSRLNYGKKVKPKKPKEDPVEVNRNRALKSFDDLYKKVYGDDWPSMRVALLASSKTALLVNNFSDLGRVINELEDKGILSVHNAFELRKQELNKSNEELDTDLIQSEPLNEEQKKLLEGRGDQYFKEKSKLISEKNDETFTGHKKDKMHEDPTVDLPLEETLANAQFDKARIIESNVTGSALSATLNEFVPPSEIMGKNDDWILNTEQFLDYERSADVIVDLEFENEIHFPPNLHVYSYERGNIEEYDSPRMGSVRTIDYEEFELSSLLPVLALGLEPKDKVLDMCTETPHHGLMMLQTLYLESVRMNIHSETRLSEIHRAMKLHFKDSDYVNYTVSKELLCNVFGDYNKILLCVPNLDDRRCLHSAHTYFNPLLSRERLLLPDEQTDIVVGAVQVVQPGGTVVYSTTTLSPLQNEGVIRSAIGRLRYEHGIEVKVKDLTRALRPLDCFFKFAPREVVGLGHLALPFLPMNTGPRYICKLVKVPGEDDAPDDAERLNG